MKKHISTMTDDEYENVLEEALVDSYGDIEQLASFCVYLQDRVTFPIYGSIIGKRVKITDITNDNSRVLALVRVGDKDYAIDLMSIEFERNSPLPITAYKEWRGAGRP